MSYATAADIDDRYGADLLDRVADTQGEGERDGAAIERALADAAATIDGYVSARHVLPLAVTPPLLTVLAIDLAIHRLALRPGLMTEEIEERAKDARKMLQDIGAGRASLGLQALDASSPDAPMLVARPRLFTRETDR